MKLLVVSDLHFEFQRDGGESLVENFDKDVDVLVVAGDLSVGKGLADALTLLLEKFEHVVYLAGNHEYYGTTRQVVIDVIEETGHRYPGLHWLRPGNIVCLDGQRFLGGTLWFPNHPTAPKYQLNDFRLIKDFESWVYVENQETVNFLNQEVKSTDVVVTHHLPSYRSVAKEYQGSSLNPFFVCDIEPTILKTQPRLWIHGHTHTSCDYFIQNTRVVCNPFGYAQHEENVRFDPNLVIDLKSSEVRETETPQKEESE
jgi:Icc-related predicted phosphoesterase